MIEFAKVCSGSGVRIRQQEKLTFAPALTRRSADRRTPAAHLAKSAWPLRPNCSLPSSDFASLPIASLVEPLYERMKWNSDGCAPGSKLYDVYSPFPTFALAHKRLTRAQPGCNLSLRKVGLFACVSKHLKKQLVLM